MPPVSSKGHCRKAAGEAEAGQARKEKVPEHNGLDGSPGGGGVKCAQEAGLGGTGSKTLLSQSPVSPSTFLVCTHFGQVLWEL